MGVFADVLLMADTSAICAYRNASVADRAQFGQALKAGELMTHPVVRLEFLHDAFDREVFGVRERMFGVYEEVPMDAADGPAAVQALHDLAYKEPKMTGYHKVMAGDALIAAAAVRAGVGVLHHDHHFERLAEVMPELVQVLFVAFK